MKIKLLLLSLAAMLLHACSTTEGIQGISTAAFGAGGAYGGYRACKEKDKRTSAACIAAGAFVGAVIGNFIGSQIIKSMQRRDRQQLNAILERQNNGNGQWQNPNTGTVFYITDIRTHNDCKNFTLNASNRKHRSQRSERHQACKNNGRFI
ncbi:MAG: hypothetical protein Q9M22_00025 [Mariprofundaceae bacterium]|nr:hypothetical protein [Mariprofundaceae bacterium]